MLVIPWSEVVKRALPQQASPQKEPGEQGEPDPPQDSSSPAVVMHAQTAQAPQLPASETPIPESKTSPSSAAEMPLASLQLSQLATVLANLAASIASGAR